MLNESESVVSKINANVFFKEFTFAKTDFKSSSTKVQLELADNVVWLDEIFSIYQIKERGKINSDSDKWFDNKVLGKAVKQIKSTIGYLSSYPELLIENQKGHKLDIIKALKVKNPKRIIIYSPGVEFPEAKRSIKFYESKEIGLIHLFHIEDYFWICKFLITPTEVDDYLNFRERLFLHDKERSNALPEQYFVGHYMETPDADHFDISYITNVTNKHDQTEDFDISRLLEGFSNKITLVNNETEYYPIIAELAKLNREELKEFKKRLSRSIEVSEKNLITSPYRIYAPRTDCAFVFIPMHSTNFEQHWRNALYNITLGQKYDMKAQKCVGVVVARDINALDHFQLFWQFVDFTWEYDEEIEKLLRESSPFRKVKLKKVVNRYKSS